jgi:broad specificity phosphatase PhoE
MARPGRSPVRAPIAAAVTAGLLQVFSLYLPSPGTAADAHLWDLLRQGGVVVLVRHAHAPGIGDPDRFRIDDCSTQRNLDATGRRAARALGDAFRRERVVVDSVYSSQWCRCKDTAALAFGKYEEQPALNSFFSDRGAEGERTRALRELIAGARPGHGVTVLVTHQVNITALTGVSPKEAEVVVARHLPSGDIEVVGRLTPTP